MNVTVQSPRRIRCEIISPGDKSVSHRAAIFNSVANGDAKVTNFSPGQDCSSTVQMLRDLGVEIERTSAADPKVGDELVIKGRGSDGLQKPDNILDAGNSGTAMRLMCGILAARPFQATMAGDESLQSRPMERIIKPLEMMGAVIKGRENNTLAPLRFMGGELNGIEYDMPVASAQLKSAIILAGIRAEGETQIHQPEISRDHTERMLTAMGADVNIQELDVSVRKSNLECRDVQVPGDISSAAFWMVAGITHPNAEILICNVGINPTRAGVITALRDMGGEIELLDKRDVAGEPVADISVRSSELRGTELAGGIIPLLIDEVPIIAVAAAMAQGETIIRDAAELRVKETDRISATVKWMSAAGVLCEATADGMAIQGAGRISGGTFQSEEDHRLAMSLGIAGLIADDPVTIADAESASISYPHFWEEIHSLGGVVA